MFDIGGKDYIGDSALMKTFFLPLFATVLVDFVVLITLVVTRFSKFEFDYSFRACGKKWHCKKRPGLCGCWGNTPIPIRTQEPPILCERPNSQRIMYISLSTTTNLHNHQRDKSFHNTRY